MINPFKDVLRARRQEVPLFADLSGLANRLDTMLVRVQRSPIIVSREKALLSQDGGVCPSDGARLVFDPFQPEQHRCPACHTSYSGDRHHRAWVWRYHLWFTERTVHAALLASLDISKDRNRGWCQKVLAEYAAVYPSYPNKDNVLGPTRLFFSTYLESIWLLQLIIAAMLLTEGESSLAKNLQLSLESLVDESSTLIASYDEGLSNRQVWNTTAILAAGLFLNDERRIEASLRGSSGIGSLLTNGVAPNGRWHEGENYHLFALRGFLLAAELGAAVGNDLYAQHRRFGLMYTAPLATMFPDLTLAARGDSPYGVSVRQPRFAELWELGFARTKNPQLATILNQLYDGTDPSKEIGVSEIAEVEQNYTAMGLDRTRLSWKALLWMTGEPSRSSSRDFQVSSVVLEPNGPMVIRTDDGRHVGLEGAGTGLGHGHPDRLHLTVFDRAAILMDFGTGSYVDASLHWYRSWLSHNVPVQSGDDGRSGYARCDAYDQSAGWQWCRATLHSFADDVSSIVRSVVVGPDYIVDIVQVNVPPNVEVSLPVHLLGYDIVADDVMSPGVAGLRFGSRVTGRGDVFSPVRDGEIRDVAEGPGPPPLDFGHAKRIPYMVRRCTGSGRWVHVFARRPDSVGCVTERLDDIVIATAIGRDVLRVNTRGVGITHGAVAVHLSGLRPAVAPFEPDVRHGRLQYPCRILDVQPSPDQVEDMLANGYSLEDNNYRRSEQPYPGADVFAARWCMYAIARQVVWTIDVKKRDLVFRPVDAVDPKLDNETPDIHSDGVQFYLGDAFDRGAGDEAWIHSWRGYLIVPDVGEPTGARVRRVFGENQSPNDPRIHVAVRSDGFRVVVTTEMPTWPSEGVAMAFDLVVNEMYEGRERRAGQLALSGGGWVYLRGDRESPATASVCVFA